MTLPNALEIIASGGVIATHTVANKEYQTVVLADVEGHIVGSRPDYLLWFPPGANAANRVLGDLFNTGTVPIRVRGIWIIPTMTAITGATIEWAAHRTTSAGTGGTAVTPATLDSAAVAWPSGATARAGATGGAAVSNLLFNVYTLNEETNAGFTGIPYQNQLPQLGDRVCEVVLRQNEGLSVRQTAIANAVGLTGLMLLATFDN